MAEKEKRPILLLGSYGRGNVGDDVFLVAALTLFPDRQIYINSADDSLLPAAVKGKIKTISTNGAGDFFKKLRLLFSVKDVVYWGGDVWVKWYENRWQTQPLYQMVVLNFLLRILGKKVSYVGCGIGNLKGYSLFLARLSARMANSIVVREQRSADVLKLATVQVLPDLAINLPYYKPVLHALPPKGKKFIVAISVLYYLPNPEKEFPSLVKSLASFIEGLPQESFEFILFPMLVSEQTKNDDLWASEQILSKLNRKQKNVSVYVPTGLEDSIQKLSTCHLVIGTRLHTNILATFNAVPCIGVAYRPKVSSFFESNGLSNYYLNLSDMTKLKETFMDIINTYADTAKLFMQVSETNLTQRVAYKDIFQKH